MGQLPSAVERSIELRTLSHHWCGQYGDDCCQRETSQSHGENRVQMERVEEEMKNMKVKSVTLGKYFKCHWKGKHSAYGSCDNIEFYWKFQRNLEI